MPDSAAAIFASGIRGICSSQSGGAEDFVYLLLSETGIFTLGFFYTLYECVKFSDISNYLMLSLIMLNFLVNHLLEYEV